MKKNKNVLSGKFSEIKYTKPTAYQNIKVLNKLISKRSLLGYEKDEGIQELLDINKRNKKDLVKFKKDLKRYKTNAKGGAKNKGWISRTQAQIDNIEMISRDLNNQVRAYSPQNTVKDGVTTHYDRFTNVTTGDLDRQWAHKEIQEKTADMGGFADGSLNLQYYIDSLILEYFGSRRAYNIWQMVQNTKEKEDIF